MSPKSENKEIAGTKRMADMEISLAEKTKLAETYLSQLRFARADLENLQKHVQRRIKEGITTEKAKLIMQILTVAEEIDLSEYRKKLEEKFIR